MLYNGRREWLRHESICIKSKNQTIYYLSKSVWVDGIISINQKRWQIEECFRIMKRKQELINGVIAPFTGSWLFRNCQRRELSDMGLERIYSAQTQGTRRQKIYAVNPVR